MMYLRGKLVIGMAMGIVIVVSGCSVSQPTVRVPVDRPDNFNKVGTESQDLGAMCQQFAASILQTPAIRDAAKPPRVAFAEVDNRSEEKIDTDMFLEKTRTQLVKFSIGKLAFLDRKLSSEIIRERSEKRSQEREGTVKGARWGADYFLTGLISSIPRTEGSKESVFTRYAFRLTDAETEEIVWEDEYETKKEGQTPSWKR